MTRLAQSPYPRLMPSSAHHSRATFSSAHPLSKERRLSSATSRGAATTYRRFLCPKPTFTSGSSFTISDSQMFRSLIPRHSLAVRGLTGQRSVSLRARHFTSHGSPASYIFRPVTFLGERLCPATTPRVAPALSSSGMHHPQTPNQALQRTAPAVTLAAAGLRLAPAVQPARQPPQSLSLGSVVSPSIPCA